MSWTSCMQNKIINHYGSEASECVSGIEKDNLEKIAECIANVVLDANEEAVLTNLTAWSVECEL